MLTKEIFIADKWQDYELIDTGDGERLERWGKYILRRPDPHVIWPPSLSDDQWQDIHAHYHRSSEGGGRWEFRKKVPERWTIRYREMAFNLRLMGFKHTGLFPEQAANWEWIIEKIKSRPQPVRVLNLFAYTGGASVAAALAGAEVCHIDAAKGMVTLAKENLTLSGLGDRPVRFIVDDVFKFVLREQRRGRKYDGIIMDPPSFGRGPNGEVWKIENELFRLVQACSEVMQPDPLFFLLNSYTNGLTPAAMGNILKFLLTKRFGGTVSFAEIGLPVTSGIASGIVLPCGACARWEASS